MKYLRSTNAFSALLVFSAIFFSFAVLPVRAQDAAPSDDARQKADAAASGHDADQAPPPVESQLIIVRNLSGEFAKALQPLPGGKQAFKISAGEPLDLQRLQDWVRTHGGPAANPGDTVQITLIEFQPRSILFQFNGGGKKKIHWREHLSIGIGASQDPVAVSHPGEGVGGTIVLDFGKPLPPLNSEELKHDLAVFFDFSKQSATKNWVDTLPTEFQDAIKDHHAVVGMDQETVIAALGRPDKKVRSHDAEGNETEDWIYGDPPARTTFVTFIAGKVSKVQEFG